MKSLRNGQTVTGFPAQRRTPACPTSERDAGWGGCCREVPLAGAGSGPGSELGSGRSHVAFSVLIPVELGSAAVCCMACGEQAYSYCAPGRWLRGWPDQSDPPGRGCSTLATTPSPGLWNAWDSLRRPICVCSCPFLAHMHTEKHTHTPLSLTPHRQQQVQNTQPHGVHNTPRSTSSERRAIWYMVPHPKHTAVASRPSSSTHAHTGGADLHGTHEARCLPRHLDVDARSTSQ